MIKRDHPEAANIFAQKANIEISECKCSLAGFIFHYILPIFLLGNELFEKNPCPFNYRYIIFQLFYCFIIFCVTIYHHQKNICLECL